MSRESYGGGGQYGMGSSSSSNASSGGFGGGRDASQSDFSSPSAGGRNDNRDPSIQYQTPTTITPETRETLENQRTQAIREISPMTDPKNKAIALALNLLVPFGGTFLVHIKMLLLWVIVLIILLKGYLKGVSLH